MTGRSLRNALTPALVLSAILALVLIAYGRSIVQGFAPIDDSFLVYYNLAVRGVTWENLKAIFTTYDPELYIPATLFTFQLNYMMGGLNAEVYHITNLLLHAANALLVTWYLTLLSGKRSLGIIGGLLFAVHPLHTEAVVWIAGRKDLLCGFFFLLSLIGYVKYRGGSSRWYVVSILCFLLALLSKVLAITLPAILILQDLLIERRPLTRKLLIDKLPYIALAFIFFIIAALGKERVLASSSILETVLMAMRSTMFYVGKLFVPVNLSVFYPHQGAISLFDPVFALSTLGVIALFAFALFSLRKWPWITFAIAFFLITLAPTFLNFHKGDAMFFAVDRYAYLPSIGFLLLVLMVVRSSMERLSKHGTMGVLAGIIAVFAVLSHVQTRVWDSPEKLFSNALALYPESVSARTDLARIFRESGQLERAFEILKDGLAYGDDGHLHIAAGAVYAASGQVTEAMAQYTKAQEMLPENPEPLFALGSLAEHEKRTDEAMAHYRTAVEMDPSYVAARVRLATLLLQQGKASEAEEQLTEALKWNSSSYEAQKAMGELLTSRGEHERAYDHLSKAVSLRPHELESLILLAENALALKKFGEVGELLTRARSIDQGNARVAELFRRLEKEDSSRFE
ncbi:MAG: tetratricopeptide repeat protein [Candidatus Peregrinibacteria bacterium]|nr:tetratricopeptide repeat protein [Candidatus Peregrinibacteria bacterium]